jgi:hypothetical protein
MGFPGAPQRGPCSHFKIILVNPILESGGVSGRFSGQVALHEDDADRLPGF